MASVNFSNITATSTYFTISGLYSHFNDGDEIDIEAEAYNTSSGVVDSTYSYEGKEVNSSSFTGILTHLRPSTTYRVDITITKNDTIILASYTPTIISDSNDGISVVAADVNISGTFTTSVSHVEISFSNATDTQILAAVSGISTDFNSSYYNSLWIKYDVYYGSSFFASYSESDITGKSSYSRYITNLSDGTYTLKATIYTKITILASLEETELSYQSGQYVYERDFTIGSGGSTTYEPDLSSAAIIERSSLITSSQIGVRVTGLDSNYPGTYTIILRAYANGKYYSSTPSSVTVSSGSIRSDDIVFTGLPSNTTFTVLGNIMFSFGDTDGQEALQSISVSTSAPSDSYYPDFDRIVIHTSTTSTSITAYATGIDTDYSYGDWTINWILYENYPNGRVASKSDSLRAGLSQTGNVSFTGLDQNMTYDLVLRLTFRYAGSSYSEEIFEIVQTGTDANYVPNMDDSDLWLSDASASTDYALKVRVNGLDSAFSGTWSIKYIVKKDGVTVTTKTVSQSGNVSNSSYTQITGLQSGVNYQVYAEISVTVRGTKYTWYCDNEFVTSGSIEVEDSYGGALNASLSLKGGDDGTWITAQVVGLDKSYSNSDRYVWWYLNDEYYSEARISPGASQSSAYTFNYLTPGIKYTVKAEIHYVNDDDSPGVFPITGSLTTSEEFDYGSATLVLDSSTAYTLTVYIAGLDTSYSRNDRSVVWYRNNTALNNKGTWTIAATRPTSSTYTYSNLTPSTRYTLRARIYYTVNGSETYKDVSAIFTTPSLRPDYFEWDTAKVPGGNFNITASEWKKLLQNIEAVRAYKGVNSANFSYPSKGDTFLASHYNTALNGITGILGSGYNANAVQPGWDITAARINLLRDMINDIE